MRHAVEAPRRQPFEGREADAEAEAGRGVRRVEACDTAIDQQATERHDEGLQVHPRDEEAVDEPEQHAQHQHEEECRRPGQLVSHHEVDEQHAEQGDDRAHRQFDAAGDDDKRLADGKEPEQSHEVRRVAEIDRRQEQGIDERHHRAHHQDEDEQADIFLDHAVAIS